MASPKQIVVMVGLLGAAGAVWVPQALREQEDAGLVQEEVPAIIDDVTVSFDVADAAPGDAT